MVRTDISETKEVALQTLLSLINSLQAAFVPYMKPTASTVAPLVRYKSSESIRGLAASICAALVLCLKGSECIAASREMLNLVWEAAQA